VSPDKFSEFKIASGGEEMMQMNLRLLGSAGDGQNLADDFLFLQPNSLFHGYFVKGVHAVLDSVRDDPFVIWSDSHL
jgi:hypothetical protein